MHFSKIKMKKSKIVRTENKIKYSNNNKTGNDADGQPNKKLCFCRLFFLVLYTTNTTQMPLCISLSLHFLSLELQIHSGEPISSSCSSIYFLFLQLNNTKVSNRNYRYRFCIFISTCYLYIIITSTFFFCLNCSIFLICIVYLYVFVFRFLRILFNCWLFSLKLWCVDDWLIDVYIESIELSYLYNWMCLGFKDVLKWTFHTRYLCLNLISWLIVYCLILM